MNKEKKKKVMPKASVGDIINTIPFGDCVVKKRFLDRHEKRWYTVDVKGAQFDVQESLCNKIVKRLS
jgi:hypothetical protein